jgi:hypothetical protein
MLPVSEEAEEADVEAAVAVAVGMVAAKARASLVVMDVAMVAEVSVVGGVDAEAAAVVVAAVAGQK